MFDKIADQIEQNATYLDELDAVMGDGEHGHNMKKCFGAVKEKLPQWQGKSNVEILGNVGMELLTAGGGTATTLLGFFMKKASGIAGEKAAYDTKNIAEILDEALASTMKKSQAEVGDKTLMDVLIPSVQTFVKTVGSADIKTAVKAAAEVSAKSVEATKQMIAKRGRGFYVADRGLGTADPGAASLDLIIQAVYQELLNEGEGIG